MTPEQEKRMREIAQEVFNNLFNNFRVPHHIHNGMDSAPINSKDIIGFSQLPSTGAGVLGTKNNYNGGTFTQNTSGNTVAFPIPLVYFRNGGGFNAGDAPDGTMVISTGGSYLLTNLWIKDSANGVWWRFDAGGAI